MAFTMQSLTPVMFVDAIEPCLDFWKRLGFEISGQVPEGDSIGFIMLRNGPVEVMYESRPCLARDVPSMADYPSCHALYIHVTNIEEVIAAAGDAPVLMPKRTAFYGAVEITYREPGGNAVTFSEMSANAG